MRVEVDKTMKGRPFNHGLAYTRQVRTAVEREARGIGYRANGILKSRPGGRFTSYGSGEAFKKRPIPSWITVEPGRVDWFVVLNDTAGDVGAWNIEMGREGGFTAMVDENGHRIAGTTRYTPPMAPVAPLRKGAGIF